MAPTARSGASDHYELYRHLGYDMAQARRRVFSRTVGTTWIALAAVATLLLVPATPAQAVVDATAELDFLCRTNEARAVAGRSPLRVASDLTRLARDHSSTMANEKELHHNPDLRTDVSSWRFIAENVGFGPSVASIHDALMNSDGHRDNILNSRVTEIGIGVERRDGQLWVTQVFREPTHTSTAPEPSCGAEPSADIPVPPGGIAVVGDWNGDGRSTPGRFVNGTWYLSNRPSGTAQIVFTFGREGDTPLVGDWDGSGRDGIGIVRDRTWHLKDDLSAGKADRAFVYGQTTRGDLPIVGDWDGRGPDGIGIIRDGDWHLRQAPSSGPGQTVFTFGRITRGDRPLIGDWNGDGRDRIGIVRNGEWHLRHSLSGGNGQLVFTYGRVAAGDQPMIGDWDRDGVDGIGIVRGTDWHIRNSLSRGDATAVHRY